MSLKRCERCGFYYDFDQFGVILIQNKRYPDPYDRACRKYVDNLKEIKNNASIILG